MTILEDLLFRLRINVAVAKGFENLELPRDDERNTKRYIDLWPIQMSAALGAVLVFWLACGDLKTYQVIAM